MQPTYECVYFPHPFHLYIFSIQLGLASDFNICVYYSPQARAQIDP